MRKTVLRRLEALEKEYRSREQRELSSLRKALFCIWEIVLAYHLGDLKSDEDPGKAIERALKYPPRGDYFDILEIPERYNDAYRRLFAKVGLDFDNTPPSVLFDAFVTMVNELPEQRWNWLWFKLHQRCPDAEIAVGSNLPRRLSCDNFLLFKR
jgi:hypothetical protein